MTLDDVPTPALVLDRGRLTRNLARMSERARRGGVDLRPHMKTAKCLEVARLATEGHSGGITVSTLAEADFFAAGGVTDLVYAVCIVPEKLPRVAEIEAAHGARVRLLVDSLAGARALARAASPEARRFGVLVEIDCGEHRTGVDAEAPDLVDIARAVHEAPGLELEGVLTHGGHAYDAPSVAAVREVAESERRAVVRAAERLRGAGLPCATVSAGSTPTAVHAPSFEGLTEIRPGVYTLFDLAQHALGSCEAEDIAVSVLATVISHQPRHERIIIDAGGLALSKDRSARLPDTGYGWVCDLALNRIANLHVAVADQEHGYVTGAIDFDRLPVGSRVRVLPNHACMTAAGHARFLVVDDGPEVVGTWARCAGW